MPVPLLITSPRIAVDILEKIPEAKESPCDPERSTRAWPKFLDAVVIAKKSQRFPLGGLE